MDEFDVVVVGGGSGGYVAAIRLAQLGRSVAVVERDRLGGTCLHRGCIPTKVFLESADFYQRVRRADEWGVSAEAVAFDFAKVAARRERIVGANEQGIKGLFRANGITTIDGIGRLGGPGKVVVSAEGGGERVLVARDVLLATGSRPRSLPGLEIDGDLVVTSDHVTHWTDLPGSAIVVGGGAVGAEFASLLNDFGVAVTLVEFLSRLLPLEDAEIGEHLDRQFARRGIQILTGAAVRPETLKRRKGELVVEVEISGDRRNLAAERLIVATGRGPVVDGLDLKSAGVELTDRGFVRVDGSMRTTASGVYACGDLVGGLMLAHVAFAEGEIAAAAITGKRLPPVDYNQMPRATYTRPEVASVGLSEEEARAAGHNVRVGRFGFRANPKAMIHGESDGLAKLVADADSGEILGAHLIGPHVTELIGEVVLGKVLESTYEEIATTVHGHPTLAEALAEAARDLEGSAIHVPPRPAGARPSRTASTSAGRP